MGPPLAVIYLRILQIARTIADMAGSDQLQFSHMAEAVQYQRKGYFIVAVPRITFRISGENQIRYIEHLSL